MKTHWRFPGTPTAGPAPAAEAERNAGRQANERSAALDGLRGLAACSVIVFHVGHWLHESSFAANAGLAVDFFFCLSGFVIAHVYGKRVAAGWGPVPFLSARVIRLFPVLIVATLISAAYVVPKSFVKAEPAEVSSIVSAIVLGFASIPYLNAPAAIGGPQIFPLNGPQYTVFLEIVVNMLWFALFGVRPLIVLALSALGFTGIMVWGVGGDTTQSLLLGLPRVMGPFFLGVFLHTLERHVPPDWQFGNMGFAIAAGALALLLLYPVQYGPVTQLIGMTFVVPAIVLFGFRSRLTGGVATLALVSGELSYAIYALQYPVFCWINGAYQYLMRASDPFIELWLVMAATIALAYVVDRFVDVPARRWLNKRFARSAAVPQPRPVAALARYVRRAIAEVRSGS